MNRTIYRTHIISIFWKRIIRLDWH